MTDGIAGGKPGRAPRLVSTDERGRAAAIAASWEANAAAWTEAVREGRIASRRIGTDAAVVAAILRAASSPAPRVLDVGCGEGWLARALVPHGARTVGVDASPALVARARELGGGDFHVLDYDALCADRSRPGGAFDVIALNFALLAESVTPLLASLGARLAPGGRIVLQTVHPWSAAGAEGYADGWRLETFDAFGGAFEHPMPWFFRTLESWTRALHEAGLAIACLEEPRDPAAARPLSLLLTLGVP